MHEIDGIQLIRITTNKSIYLSVYYFVSKSNSDIIGASERIPSVVY